MFAAAAVTLDRLPPAAKLWCFSTARDDKSPKAKDEVPAISPYLRRPLRPLEEVQKKREKIGKPRDEDEISGQP
ncbi:MAG: hypothetical protein IT562_08560 [Alphaproteobacteria bacterium]|nr:hypothetical protein [Alphaproteobacteria bacterium]